jgi:Tfp pilus assembly protein FimT
MSNQETQKVELCAQSRELLKGKLKHTRTAALALALVPLAAVAVSTQVNENCSSGGICGTVFYDANNNGIQDATETGIPGVSVTLTFIVNGTPQEFTVATSSTGVFDFGSALPRGEHTISVQIPPGTTASPANEGLDDNADSDGEPDGEGNSVATVNWTPDESQDSSTDFGFTNSSVSNPGTGTPGYWKNHPDAWPMQTITVGTVTYTKAQAIALLDQVGKDKSLTMFSSLVPAILNVAIGNDPSCVQSTIDAAQAWMVKYGPAGSGVHAASYAWKVGEPLHRLMDN